MKGQGPLEEEEEDKPFKIPSQDILQPLDPSLAVLFSQSFYGNELFD